MSALVGLEGRERQRKDPRPLLHEWTGQGKSLFHFPFLLLLPGRGIQDIFFGLLPTEHSVKGTENVFLFSEAPQCLVSKQIKNNLFFPTQLHQQRVYNAYNHPTVSERGGGGLVYEAPPLFPRIKAETSIDPAQFSVPKSIAASTCLSDANGSVKSY